MVRAVVIAATMVVAALAATAPAAAKAYPAFSGACELQGVARFSELTTNTPRQATAEFRTLGDMAFCDGELFYGNRSLGRRVWPVLATARVAGEFSCISGQLDGKGTITVLDRNGRPLRVRQGGDRHLMRFTGALEQFHAVQSDGIRFTGGPDPESAEPTHAYGHGGFTPSVEAIARCGQDGVRRLPFTVRLITDDPFVSAKRT